MTSIAKLLKIMVKAKFEVRCVRISFKMFEAFICLNEMNFNFH